MGYEPPGRWRFPAMLASFLAAIPAAGAADEGSFRDEVAPIFETHCLRCHGGAVAKGGLSLATADALRRGGEGGAVVEPGRPEESPLLEMVSGDRPRMPRGEGPLTAAQVESLRRWIARGAPWPEDLALRVPPADPAPWWAVHPLSRPEVPAIKDAGRARTPIDAFVIKALESRGLALRPEADRRTLIRRLTYDLIGLPPAPEEVEAFLADGAPDAYDRLVDRLLASPRYGERQGRRWLDVVHYADTHGFDKDKRRDHAWPYRDYVIAAFNDDTPYDRFVREQLAGDVLSPDDPRAVAATGFVAAGPWDIVGHAELREGTVEKEKTRLLDRDDMLSNAMSTFVSLTVHCARCHDHKFDPIPQADYYRLQAVFAGVDRGDRPIPDRPRAERLAALEGRRRTLAGRLAEVEASIASRKSPELDRLDDDLRQRRGELAGLPSRVIPEPSKTNGYHGAIMATAVAEQWVQVDLGRSLPIDEIRLVPARPVDFPDTPGFGFPVRFRIDVSDDPEFARASRVEDRTGSDVLNPGDAWWVVRPGGRPARHVRVTATKLWERTGDYVFALGELSVLSGGANVAAGASVSALNSIEAGRWSTRSLVDGFDSRGLLEDAIDPALASRRSDLRLAIQRLEARRPVLAEASVPPELRASRDRIVAESKEVEALVKQLPPEPRVYALVSHAPRPIRILKRGDVEQPGEPADPGALGCVPGLESRFAATEDEGARRVALAGWIADPRNPLTWRSIVNRIWQHHFGRGLVDTPNDFGRNGSSPTHPELLDWLAVEFRDGGRSMKALHRLIVRSAAYRQASTHDPAAAAVDAGDRLIWRMDRRRLEAEEFRDAALAVAGRLDLRMGGPGYEPFRFKDDHSPVYDHDAPEKVDAPDLRRRAVYRFAVRSVPDPFLECLDGADPNASVPVRNATITALQALALLNEPFLIRQAEAWARRLESRDAGRRGQIEAAYAQALCRPPRPDERDALVAYAEAHGLAAACRLLFNLNEFAFVD